MKTRILTVLLTTSMVLGCLTGCQSSELNSYSEMEEQNTETTESQETAETPETPETKDYTPCFESYDPDEVMMRINGIDVTWDELFYWYMYDVNNIEMYMGGIEDYDAECPMADGKTYREYIQDNAIDTVKHYCACKSKAEDMGVALSDEDQKIMQEQWNINVENYGGGDEEVFIEYLKNVFLTKELYNHISEGAILYDILFKENFGANGELLDEQEVINKASEMGYMHVKHILIKTTDDTGVEYPEDEIAEKEQQANDLIEELRAIEDHTQLEARFDEMVKEFGEDPGTEYYTDGYTFTPGTMAFEFETASSTLTEYEISDATKTTYGYHIIMRLPLKADAVVEYAGEENITTLSKIVALDIFETMSKDWADEAEVEFTSAYTDMDFAEVFSKATIK